MVDRQGSKGRCVDDDGIVQYSQLM